ncbi:MAG TPA: histidine--tRNA ligase [Candidatus Saccharimonadales bacterium]|jgi:histidyl-tRNA synthetase|nr:histidine--tRNA ligase [Candidatus Saccharimonadales bacterium]
MTKNQGPLSGFRDLLSEQMLNRDEILGKIKSVYELYGFVPLKTPALELFETLSGKYGEEGDRLMYSFKDNGDRQVALRYDQTVPLARVMAQYNDLPKPYKRYVLGDVWRGESPQAGRFREFSQFDADIVGISDYTADVEIIAMMSDAIKSIGVEATIYVNDRKILDGLSRSCGIDTNREFIKLVSIIDKIDKIGKVTVLRDVEKLIGENGRKQIDKFLSITGDSLSKLKQISEILDDKDTTMACEQLSNILTSLKNAGYSEKQITFDQTIARGLSYYTGTIFETKLIKCPEIGSICSGGRYDNLIKQLGGPDLPAIGTSIGVDRLMEGISLLGIGSKIKTKTKVYVVNLNSKLNSERFKIASILRENNIPTEMIYQDSRLKNQLRDIDKLGVSEVILFGENEQKNNTFIAKNLDKGTQQEVPLSNLIDYYKKVFK